MKEEFKIITALCSLCSLFLLAIATYSFYLLQPSRCSEGIRCEKIRCEANINDGSCQLWENSCKASFNSEHDKTLYCPANFYKTDLRALIDSVPNSVSQDCDGAKLPLCNSKKDLNKFNFDKILTLPLCRADPPNLSKSKLLFERDGETNFSVIFVKENLGNIGKNSNFVIQIKPAFFYYPCYYADQQFYISELRSVLGTKQ